MIKNIWGYALALDVSRCNPKSIRCPIHIANFSKTLVKEIDMVAYGQPHIVHFGTGNKAGFTLVQLIETSNITAHFCEEDNSIFFDVFSCKPYDIETAVKVVKDYFEPKIIHKHYIERSIPVSADAGAPTLRELV